MVFDYERDVYGRICLVWAKLCKTEVGFGAVLVKGERFIGVGRNRLADSRDRRAIPRVDYAIHAEQAAIADAIYYGVDPTNAKLYVLGVCLIGKNKGKLTTRTERIFVCNKCPVVIEKYNITTHIPHVDGWMAIRPDEIMAIGKSVAGKGYWKDFVRGE